MVAPLTQNPHSGGQGGPDSGTSGDVGKGQLIQVATRCATIDEFVEKFAAFAWEGSLVLPAGSALPVGTQGRFVILLRDHSVAMRGRCRVTESKPQPATTRNPGLKKIMMRVALLEMDDASRAIHKRLIALRSAPVPLPVATEPSETTQIEPARQGSAPHAGAPAPAAAPPAPAAAPAPPAPAVAPPAPAAAAAPPAGVVAPPIKSPPPAPRVSLQKTMIGIGIGPDGKPVLAQPAPTAPPPLRSPTPPPVEARAPGAPDTLPANPLSDFGAADVNSFIEHKLHEAEKEMPPGKEEAAPDGPPSADRPAVPGQADAAAARLARLTANLPPGLQRLVAKVPPQTQRRIVRVAPFAALAIVGLVVGFALRGKPPAPRPAATVAAAPAAPAPALQPAPPPAEVKADPPPAPAAVAARVEPAPAKAPAVVEKAAPPERPAAAPPAAASSRPGACTARVVTEPKDVKVIWGGKLLGSTPLDGARVPCGPATVSLERERWQVVTVDVNAEEGVAASVHERLRRPRATLAVTSTPPGAQISVNRVAAGPAPKQLDVQRYEKLQIKATLKGYAPWTKTVYLKEPEEKLDIQLSARK